LQRLYGPRLVSLVLYGSQARGDAEEGSDIDVLVVLEGPVRPGQEIAHTGVDVAEVSLAHNVAVACMFVSREQFEHEQSPLLINVRREGVAA
jgi:predicted nucleotidyltransferase